MNGCASVLCVEYAIELWMYVLVLYVVCMYVRTYVKYVWIWTEMDGCLDVWMSGCCLVVWLSGSLVV